MAARPHAMFESIRIADNPFAEVQKFITRKVSEDEFLEFKGGRGDETSVKRYWSQALSGFANTGGGILIFGVKTDRVAQPDGGRPIDTAVGEDLVAAPHHVVQLLKDVRLSATTDLVQGVDYLPVVGPDGKGFVVCLVPEGNQKPYKAELDPSKNYFHRVGDNFVLLSHSLLRSLFYPRLVPKLRIRANITRQGGERMVLLSLHNYGVATAAEMVIEARSSLPVEYRGTSEQMSQFKPNMVDKPHTMPMVRLTAKQPLHPGATNDFATFGLAEGHLGGVTSFHMWFSVYMLDQEPAYFAHHFPWDQFMFDRHDADLEQVEGGVSND